MSGYVQLVMQLKVQGGNGVCQTQMKSLDLVAVGGPGRYCLKATTLTVKLLLMLIWLIQILGLTQVDIVSTSLDFVQLDRRDV